MPFRIRPRDPKDDEAIRALVAAAFGGPNEVALIDALRSAGDMVSELVAQDGNGTVVGHVAFSRLEVANAAQKLRATALAPLAVAPARQSQGVGSTLVRDAVGRLRDRGHDLIVVLGHPGYYARFGFSAMVARLLDAPYAGDSFMALELAPDTLSSSRWTVAYPRAFASL
jgi:putative acetyltransferase